MKKNITALLILIFPLFIFAQTTANRTANRKHLAAYLSFDRLKPCATYDYPLSLIFRRSDNLDSVHIKVYVYSFMLLQHTKIGDTIMFVSKKERLVFASTTAQTTQRNERNFTFGTYEFSLPINRFKEFLLGDFTRVEIKFQTIPELRNYLDSFAKVFNTKLKPDEITITKQAATSFVSKSSKVNKEELEVLRKWLE